MYKLIKVMLINTVLCPLQALETAFWTLPNPSGKQISSDSLNTSFVSPSIVTPSSLNDMLKREAPSMREDVRNKVLTSFNCVNKLEIPHSQILTVIDYSLPSNKKRLWVFDLAQQRLLFFSYVSHGLKSGERDTAYFSNAYNSRASSLGVYLTAKAYNGREGTSLRLKGLDRGLNDNAEGRSIVMHGGFYVEEAFIKKYGRAGRSWGCPALPHSMASAIINRIKDNNLIIAYYPSDKWFSHSPYLNCQNFTPIPSENIVVRDVEPPKKTSDFHEDVLFVNTSTKTFGGETAPILAMPATYYRVSFNKIPPLSRMLRRQMNQEEYIALSKEEFSLLSKKQNELDFSKIYFVVPTIKINRGYAQTVMKEANYGPVTQLHAEGSYYWIETAKNSHLSLQTNHQFIRWLGL
jgi:hypothetical protein